MSENKLDITSTAIEKGIDLVKDFTEKLLGATLEETGMLLADKVKTYRLKNQIKILFNAQKIAKENNLNVKQINLKALVPLLELSSLESDETLQEKWTNLLVNFIDANEKYESSIYPYILNQLSTNEILILDKISKEDITYHGTYSITGIEKSNLIRLGLIEMNYNHSVVEAYGVNYYSFKISDLGKEFVTCCSPK